MTDGRLVDFAYPDNEDHIGVIEREMPSLIVTAITEDATLVAASLGGRRGDCLWACPAWQRVLGARGVRGETMGGVGVDDDAFDALYQLIPHESRSGYREDDGQIRQHWWLAVGAEALLFDPTGHQFDDKGGLSLDRYVIDGEPWIDRRAVVE
jgi:hypothetical protein